MRVAICDDNRMIRSITTQLLQDYGSQMSVDFNITPFSSGEELLQCSDKFEIVLMDIELGGIDGICTTSLIHQKNPDTLVIILTSHVRRFKDGYKVNAFRFMTKPINKAEFFEYIGDAVAEVLGQKVITLRKNGVNINISLKYILYISAQQGYTEVWTAKDTYRSEYSLVMWEQLLDSKLFFRCHKKYLVNISQIEKLSHDILLKSGDIVEVSRRKYPELRERLMNYSILH